MACWLTGNSFNHNSNFYFNTDEKIKNMWFLLKTKAIACTGNFHFFLAPIPVCSHALKIVEWLEIGEIFQWNVQWISEFELCAFAFLYEMTYLKHNRKKTFNLFVRQLLSILSNWTRSSTRSRNPRTAEETKKKRISHHSNSISVEISIGKRHIKEIDVSATS